MTRRLLATVLPLPLAFLTSTSSCTTTTATTAPVWASAAGLNLRMSGVEGWRSGDAGATVRLADGRLLSFFGDSTLADGRSVHNSTVAHTAVRSYLAAATLFPDFPDRSQFWPGQAVAVGQRVYLVGSRQLVRGEWDWTPLGAYLAVVDVPWGGRPVFRRYLLTPSSGLGDSTVQWSLGLTVSAADLVYLHGGLDRPDFYHVHDGGYVARVPLAHLGQLDAWRYWTGSAWSSSAAAAVPTISVESHGGTEAGYTLHRRPDGTWTVTTKQYGYVGDRLGRYVGPAPWGPWRAFEPQLSTPASVYLTGAAPGVTTRSGRLLVRWSRADLPVEWAEVDQ
jgi:hypothetical protein